MKILIATDGSERSRRAAEVGVALARAMDACVLAFTAAPTYPYVNVGPLEPSDSTQFEAAVAAVAMERLGQIEALAAQAGVPCEARMQCSDAPYRAIVDTATDQGCDLIVMASHGRSGVGAILLGSETQKVLATSTLPVLVTR